MTYSVLTKDINLLPKYRIEQKSGQRSYQIALISMAGALVLFVAVAFGFWSHNQTLSAQANQLEQDILRLQETEKRAAQLEKVKRQIEARERYQSNIDKTNTSMITLLKFLDRERSNGVYLNGFSDSMTRTGEKQVTITGTAVDKDAIANFADKVKQSEMFSSVFIPTITLTNNTTAASVFGELTTNAQMYTFSIICVLQ